MFSCHEKCKEDEYAYAGLQRHEECWCGNDHPRDGYKTDEAECSLPCSGDSSVMCGGLSRLGIYFTEGWYPLNCTWLKVFLGSKVLGALF